MRTSFDINNKMTMIAEMTNDTTFQILEYDDLEGDVNLNLAIQLDYIRKNNNKLRQARIILEDSKVKVEPGRVSYYKGNINIENKSRIIGIGKKLLSSLVMKDSMHKPVIEGFGEVFLEPSFENLILIELEDEEIIIDSKAFCACEDSIEISSFKEKVDPYLEEYSYKVKLIGSGIVIIAVPVSHKEIIRCKMYKDSIKVNGDIVILRRGNIEYDTVKIENNLLGESNEGKYLNVYTGTGEVWLAPTKKIYKDLKDKGLIDIIESMGDIELVSNDD
jgi:uncharacterized protein (AIM24 family)